MSWRRLEAEAPGLARLARARFETAGVAMLGTIRADGSPRIDPIEPFFVGGELLLGVMARSAKGRALRRDPRCVLHGIVSGANEGEPEAKLHGHVEPSAVEAGWWRGRPPGEADVYRLVIEEAVTIEWDLTVSRMLVHRWTVDRGVTVSERGYP